MRIERGYIKRKPTRCQVKRRLSAAIAAVYSVITTCMLLPQSAFATNPIAQTVYTADPAPMVYDNTCYVYTSHDADGSTYFTMPDWKCYSSTDMQNWTDHGVVLSGTDFSWAEENTAWAAQCVERNGKFYMYVTLVPAATGGRAIGVAVADSPEGPFKDALGKPLIGPNWDYIDPTAFVDEDGQAYLYFGNPQLYYVKLNEDMISYSGNVNKVDMTTSAFGTRSGGDERHQTLYEEGPWFYKRNNLYYLVYAASGIPETIHYSTSSSPTGPWTFRGEIMTSGGGSFTNHPGVCDFRGKSYFFYHTGNLPGGGGFTRSVCVEEFTYGQDGSIPKIERSKEGPKQIAMLNPFERVEAETICWESGLETEVCSAGGINIANIESNDYLMLSKVDFAEGATSFLASVSSAEQGGTIELRLGSVSGTLIGTCDVPGTGGWQNWKTVSTTISGASGTQDLYLVFKGGGGFLFNVDWWQFESQANEPDENGYYFHSTFENGTENWSGRGAASVKTSAAEAYAGSQSLLVSERTGSWNGTLRTLSTSVFKPGEAYSFSANVMQVDGSSAETVYLKLEYTDSQGETQYSTIATAVAINGTWTQLANESYTIPEGATDLRLYLESAEGTFDFYADDIIGAIEGTQIEGAGQPSVTLGDLNNDGRIDGIDLTLAKRGLLYGFTDPLQELAADVNQAADVTVADLVLLQLYLTGQTDGFTTADQAK